MKSFIVLPLVIMPIFAVVFFGTETITAQQYYYQEFDSSLLPIAAGEQADPLHRKAKPATWHLGKGLIPGDQFTYKICDMILIIPESPSHCYQISMEFVDILKGPYGDVWIVQAEIDHQDKKKFSIFQISAITFDITTDGTSIPYADSVSRTLFWIEKFANKLDQKPLVIGKSWGKIATYTAPETELVVRNAETISLDSKEEQFHVFILGYNLIEQSTVNINEEFPFPVKASIYKPTASHQNIPLQFTIELVEHTNINYFADDFVSQEIFSEQNESEPPSDFEDDILLNEANIEEHSDESHTANNKSDIMQTQENQNSSENNFLDAINLEELFEMFLKEHFGDDSGDQILNYTVFLDFLNETDSTLINDQNFTGHVRQTNSTVP